MPKTSAAKKASTTNAYDEVPYSSYIFSQTSPARLCAIAHLFGLEAPLPEKARILELGCASGNNILSIASCFPKSECIGIDLSGEQIKEGKKRIDETSVKNLRLEKKSILDVKKSFGTFDYIICHGVLSWVPVEVQQKILEICRQNLAPDGVAYVSYNTLPGWNSVKSLREMMLYHTARFSNPSEKAAQAKLLLQFIRDSIGENSKNPYRDIVESELNLLQDQQDWYLLHDHLEENNIQYYFHEFMEMASARGLQYLSEFNLPSVYSGNLRPETAKVLSTSDDIIRTEQYMDFISNRRFRMTLLCHKEKTLNRALNGTSIENNLFTSNFNIPAEYKDYDYKSGTQLTFIAPSGMSLTTSDVGMIAGIGALAENKNGPMTLDEITKKVAGRLKDVAKDIDKAKLKAHLAENFLRFVFIGGITLHVTKENYVTEVSTKPSVSKLARYQAESQTWVSNQRHDSVGVNILDKALLPLLTGSNDVKSLTTKLLPKFKSGEIQMNIDNTPVNDEKTLKEKIPGLVTDSLNRYAVLGLLVK